MKAHIAALSIIAVLGVGRTAGAGDLDCAAFLTGAWTGRGEVEMFGTKSEVDNAYTFGADGSFRTINRYRSQDADWSEQDVSGTWTAMSGTDAGSCEVRMETTGDGMTASTTTTYTRVDDDTFSPMGFRMERVGQDGDGG
ncbi:MULTISPECIES: hypothetical protein [unclassified Chelatococcus]|uniref:hypothetical protein n=1 Tax=unclassified Chelatococcus TaxID=2638111 RepID=UPI001BCD5612|nr:MULTISPECIES: hypothetical protein [unclassified Chelatococcus]MBS7696209.1 hypothetical protein [Chelatococcus sp. YT9]MBX3557764.1 hypothetical protein [Chelatococcus sp.]